MRVDEVLASVGRKMHEDFEGISSAVQHRGAKGRMREAVVDAYLTRWLPHTVRVAHSGEAVSASGETSPECDVVLLDPATPPLIDEKEYRVVPAECLHGVVQVKSKLDRRALREDAEVIRDVKRLPKTAYEPQAGPVIQSSILYGREWPYFPTVGWIFAFDSIDLGALAGELTDLDADTPVEQRVDGVFVLGKGAVLSTAGGLFTAVAADFRQAVRSDNPLMLMTILMQQICQQVWSPRFRLLDYLSHVPLGWPVDTTPPPDEVEWMSTEEVWPEG
jgi:hypothetical protein